jgi:uncharacterized Zn-finger protein
MPNDAATTEIPPPEIIEVDTDNVGCDGGDGPLGHPLVYLPIYPNGQVDCPYCGRRFIRRGKADAGH